MLIRKPLKRLRPNLTDVNNSRIGSMTQVQITHSSLSTFTGMQTHLHTKYHKTQEQARSTTIHGAQIRKGGRIAANNRRRKEADAARRENEVLKKDWGLLRDEDTQAAVRYMRVHVWMLVFICEKEALERNGHIYIYTYICAYTHAYVCMFMCTCI